MRLECCQVSRLLVKDRVSCAERSEMRIQYSRMSATSSDPENCSPQKLGRGLKRGKLQPNLKGEDVKSKDVGRS
jgi:hypothetical protein